VRVFFASGPMLLTGSGSVTVANPDGYSNFTATMQPYYQYNQVLAPFQLSGGRLWQFNVPATATSYTFTAYVAATVQYPAGWIDVSPSPFTVQPRTTWMFTPTVRDVVGDPILGTAVTWSISDTTVAALAGDGTITAHRAGTAFLTATNGTQSGTATIQVTGTTRTWTGAVSTDWHGRHNWSDVIVPVSADSVYIPTGPSNMPVLNQNAQIAGVLVQNGATISIGPFDLTASANVVTGTSGGIDGSVGRVVLAGFARTVQGILPRVRVTGTYSLTGNLTVKAPLEVPLGRLTNTSFRIQATSF
jgi:hypothetical protein